MRRILNDINKMNNKHNPWVLFFFLCLFASLGFAQEVKTSIDSTTIKIGEQITYRIQVETDTVNAVIFPENQSFLPLEVIEFYKPDTAFKGPKYAIERKYALTQFDSG